MRLLARARSLFARLAFWRKPPTSFARARAHAERSVTAELPAIQAGWFLVRIPSHAGGFRNCYLGPDGAAARNEFARREAQGRSPEFYDAPGGVPRRRA